MMSGPFLICRQEGAHPLMPEMPEILINDNWSAFFEFFIIVRYI